MVKMPHWPKPVGLLQNEESLLRMQEILSRLDNPHKKLPKTVHIAGTNGKGSTLAFLQAMLEKSDKKVHTYTTPHMVEFNERITLAGEQISDEYLYEVLEKVRVASEGIRLGFYEATTAAAFLAFSEQPADYLLLETGMGGRLDATNIIENPVICIITTISKDHTDFLGDDIRLIAGEKKHIIKPGASVICSLQHDDVYEIIENYCADQLCELKCFGADFFADRTEEGLLYELPHGFKMQFGEPSLIGYHQYINAATAIAAAKELGCQWTDISRGLENTKWPSRLEKIDRELPAGWEFYLDGAHNPAAAYALSNIIEEEWQDKPTYLVYGTTRGRDTNEFLQKLAGSVQHIALTKVNFEPDSYDAEEIKFSGEATKHDHINYAVDYIINSFEPGRILCCGSLFMRGDL